MRTGNPVAALGAPHQVARAEGQAEHHGRKQDKQQQHLAGQAPDLVPGGGDESIGEGARVGGEGPALFVATVRKESRS